MNAVVLPSMKYRAWLRVEDFLHLKTTGTFDDDGKVELIEGELLQVNAQFARHAYAKSLLHLAIDRGLRNISSPLVAIVEAAVAMPPFDLPEPDIVVTGRPRRGGPLPVSEVALVIEVADTSCRFDLGRKSFVYARNRVPEYWVCDLVDNVVVRHARPGTEGYDLVDRIALGEIVASITQSDLEVDTTTLLDVPAAD